MKNAIVKLGFCLLFFFAAQTLYAAPPQVSVDRVTATPTNLTTVNFIVKFSTTVNGFTNGDVNMTGAASAGLNSTNVSVSANATPGWFNVQISGIGTAGLLTVSIPAGAATDATTPFAGNDPSTGGTPSILYDNVGPTPTITKPGQPDPTTGSSLVKFTITWDEPITSFPSGAVNLGTSDAGLGTVVVDHIAEIAPNNKTKYEVFASVPVTATGGLHVKLTIPAGSSVTDQAGNGNKIDSHAGGSNDVVYAGVAPQLATPPTAVPTPDGFIISGQVTEDGGLSSVQRGFVWRATSPVGTGGGDHKTQVGTGEGTFTGAAVTGLASETQYFYNVWADNGIGPIVLSDEQSVYTVSATPGNNSNVTATTVSSGRIDLAFTKFQGNPNADGLIILRQENTAPNDNDIKDGKPPVVGGVDMPLIIQILTGAADQNVATYQDITVQPGKLYYYAVVPFSWDESAGGNPATYNYKAGFSTDNARALSKSSFIGFNSAPATLNYAQKTGTIAAAADGLDVGSFTVYDGDNVTDDTDGAATELDDLTIHVDNWTMVNQVAILDGGSTIHAVGTPNAITGDITFNLNSGDLISGDNNATANSPDQFNFIASFNPANVIDGAIIKITVTGATTIAGSSELSVPIGGANTGVKNAIDVIGTKLVFSAITSPINPSTDFSLTVTAEDANDKVDTNGGGSVTLSKTSGTGSFTSTDTPGGLTRSLTSGVATWIHLQFSTALNKIVTADHSGSIPDKTQALVVTSLGTVVTGPSGLPATLCFNSVTTPLTVGDPSFRLIGPILVKESDGADFGSGSNQTFSLLLPAGFIFNTAKPPVVVSAGTDIGTTAAFDTYIGNNIVRIKYDVSGTGGATLDQFTISNLPIKYVDVAPVSAQPILRIGGSAVQDHNSEDDGKVHGSLSASNGSITVDFQIASANPTQTSFSKVVDPPVPAVLQGLTMPGSVILPDGPSVVFSGEGVSLDGGQYKFFANTVNNGTHDVTFTYTYTDPVTSVAGCTSNAVKTFTVFSSVISGLNAKYCINDPPTTLTTPVNTIPLFINCPLTTTPVYINSAYIYRYRDINGFWQNLPSQVQFNPGAPEFADEIVANTNPATGSSFVEVSVWYPSQCPLIYGDLLWVSSPVTINPRPSISFQPTFPFGVCSTDQPYDMVGTPYDNAHSFDEFWASPVGVPGTKLLNVVQGSTAAGWKFHPDVANNTAADKTMQLNFKHKDELSQCSNDVAVTINVFRKPPTVPIGPGGNIFIKGVADESGEFCQSELITPFTIGTPGTNWYRWYDAPGLNPVAVEGSISFGPGLLVPSVAGVPTPGTTTFNVTQAEHRQTVSFLGSTFILNAGCESDKQAITVKVFGPTVVAFGLPTTICSGFDVDLSTLGASITSPLGILGGVWSTTSTVSPFGTFQNGVPLTDTDFPDALTYSPSDDEKLNGIIELKLTSVTQPGGSPCGPVEKLVTIRVSPGVEITFPESPVRRCAADRIEIEGKVVPNTLNFAWSENGNGDLDPATINNRVSTIYMPNITEKNQGGTVTLTITTEDPDGGGPCGVAHGNVQLLISQPPRIDAGNDYDVCADKPINLNGVKPLNASSASSWSWAEDGDGSVVDPAALLTSYTPDAGENPGPQSLQNSKKITFTLTSDTPVFPNVCPAEQDQVVVTLHARATLPGATPPDPYCIGETIEPLRADPVDGASIAWYSNASLSPGSQISTNGSVSLATGEVANAEKKVTYYATQIFDKVPSGFAGCESFGQALTIIVNPLPAPIFTFANRCLGDIMQFTNGTTIAQPIDPLDPVRTITGYQWNFDDGLLNTDAGLGAIPTGTQGGATTGTYENPGHQFKNAGNYLVRLTAFTSDGCSATFVHDHDPIPVGPVPVANFDAAKLCDEDDTQFTSSSGLDPLIHVTYVWDFGDGASGIDNGSAAKNPIHQFTNVATYDVGLTITTDLNCTNSVTKKTSIFPYIKSFPYIENFESATHGWVPEGKVINGATTTVQTSWNLLTSAGSIASDPDNAAGATFWATHTNAATDTYYYNNERSVLYGPCVDMTALQRPVLAVDYFVDTEEKGDGVYIEYLDEGSPGAEWTRLGDNVGGLKWYNQNSVGGLSLLGDVGQNLSQFGWSGVGTEWNTGRYNLDAFAGKTRLRFRVVFGSNFSPVNTDIFDGFAFDYFKLESRNRVVLVENFTSKSTSPAFAQNRDAFKSFPSASASGEVVKIEYHTGLPVLPGEAADPIFSQNPMDPNARASFYGLSAVPRGYIDGYSNLAGNGMFNGAWAGTYYSTESLKTSPLDITINTPTITDGALRVTGSVVPKEIDLQANKYSLYVAIVEETVGTDAFVLRKMLPSASGRKVPLTSRGQSFTFDETWSVDKSYLSDNPKLIAVAFVQSDIINSDNERVVLQAAYNDNLPVVNFTTGIETPFLEQTTMFPNPADRMVNIELPQATSAGVDVKVIDQLGRPVMQSAIGVGQRSVSIDTSNLSGAVYIVQLKENGAYTTRRLVITHWR